MAPNNQFMDSLINRVNLKGVLLVLTCIALLIGGYFFLQGRDTRIERERTETAYRRGSAVGRSIAEEFGRGERSYYACAGSVDEDAFSDEYGLEAASFSDWENAYYDGCYESTDGAAQQPAGELPKPPLLPLPEPEK